MPDKYVPLRGGLTLSSSPLDVYAGAIKDSLNWFEDIQGGYTTVGGYERFDGKLAPSDDTYYFARFDSWDTKVTNIVDNTTIIVDSTITMRVLFTDITTEADTMIAVVCQVDASTIPDDLDEAPLDWDGTSSLVSLTPRADEVDATDLAYLEAATAYTRSEIDEIPGTGIVAGHLQINDNVVAFRDDTGVAKFYKQSSAGWVEGRFGRLVEISSYTAGDILAGDTIDTLKYLVAGVAEWYDSTGTPDVTKAWLVVVPITVANAPTTGANTSNTGATFTIDSVVQPIASWGSYIESRNHNFLADPAAEAAWFCDGTNLAMCYSSEYNAVVPISANYNAMSGKKATSITVLDDQLFYSTGTGTFVLSEPGNPFNYGGAYGAAEIGVGDLITDMAESDGENLIVYTKRGAKKLTGTDVSNMQFKTSAGNVGAMPRSVQKLDDLYSLSSRGITQLRRTEAIGGYLGGAVSTNIAEALAGLSTKLNCSTTFPNKEQIRWYFNDGKFLSMTRLPSEDGVRFSFAFGNYPDRPVTSVTTEIWSDGVERTFFTSDTGYLYEAEKGTSFDGSTIYSFVELQANHLGNPAIDKAFKRVFWEAKSEGEATMTLTYSLNYGEKSFETRDVISYGGRYIYDEGVFDLARFDSATRTRSKANLKGKGFAITFSIDHNSAFSLPINLTGYTLHYNALGKAYV